MIVKAVRTLSLSLLIVLGLTLKSYAAPSFYQACDTAAEYKKMVKYLKNQPDEVDQALSYARKKLRKYDRMSLKQRMQSKQYKQDLAKALSEFKPAKTRPPKFSCRKIPGNKLVVEKSGMFSGVACVRATAWRSCKWTSLSSLRGYWRPGTDRKNWVRK
ncbi:hypothetical protein LP7551_02710 [Roseibium album]|nr:hypothetical protein LP7551_02710 [Roseibium album]